MAEKLGKAAAMKKVAQNLKRKVVKDDGTFATEAQITTEATTTATTTTEAPKIPNLKLETVRLRKPVDGTDYVMEYTLSPEAIMEKRKQGKFDLYKEPLVEIRSTKARDLAFEFNTYCGRKKLAIKNWLYYVI